MCTVPLEIVVIGAIVLIAIVGLVAAVVIIRETE
jgi:hypothetical protein